MEERLLKSSFGLSLFLHMGVFGLAALMWASPLLREPTDRKTVWIELPKPNDDARIVRSRKGYRTDEVAPNAFLGQETRRVQEETVAKSLKGDGGNQSVANNQKREEAGKQGKTLDRLGVPIVNPSGRDRPRDVPEWSNFAESFGAVSQDYVKGLKESEVSALNTREFVFFSYFERIRKRLDLAWTPILRHELVKMIRSGRTLASDRDHVTRTVVTLDGRGKIVKVELIEESGVISLDKAAVSAFNRAGPFPNPPTGLIGKDGTIQIQWDFVLKT